MSNIFYCTSRDMKLVPDNNRAWLDYLLSVDKKKLVVSIEQETGKRSYNQNSYLWGVVYKVIADNTGSSENELHEIFKRMFLPPEFISWKETQIKVPGSTSKLDKIEFGNYIERIRAEVANLGIIIPDAIQVKADINYPVENNKTDF